MKPGKLSHKRLRALLERMGKTRDPRLVLGPRVGEDAAVVQIGGRCLVIATDPITFASDRVGWYAVQVNANDVATMGARPSWFQACILLPAGKRCNVERIVDDIGKACRALDVSVTGGHTEVTPGIDAPIVVGTMLGVTPGSRVVTSSGLRVGHRIVMTGCAAVEATAILARDYGDRLKGKVPSAVMRRAERFLFDPGIGVVEPAMAAATAGATAMHDPTEGGIVTGLWELAQASGRGIVVDEAAVPVLEETRALCDSLRVDPLRAIASGSLLIGIPAEKLPALQRRLARLGVHAVEIGRCVSGPPELKSVSGRLMKPQARDELARLG